MTIGNVFSHLQENKNCIFFINFYSPFQRLQKADLSINGQSALQGTFIKSQ